MRFTIPAVVAALLLPSGPVTAFGGGVSFPTLTWPVVTPAPGPTQPLVNCAGPDVADPALCPAPSR